MERRAGTLTRNPDGGKSSEDGSGDRGRAPPCANVVASDGVNGSKEGGGGSETGETRLLKGKTVGAGFGMDGAVRGEFVGLAGGEGPVESCRFGGGLVLGENTLAGGASVRKEIAGGVAPSRLPAETWVDLENGKSSVSSAGGFAIAPYEDGNGFILEVPDLIVDRAASNLANTLVGKFWGTKPSIDSVKLWAARKWKTVSHFEITAMPKGFFLFSFINSEDCAQTLLGGPWFLGKVALYLRKWSPGFDPEKENIQTIPIWVRLPGLPLEFWLEEILMCIAETIGKLIAFDPATKSMTRLVFARFCVNALVNKTLPQSITLSSKYGEWVQQIEYENESVWCQSCLKVGHSGKNCPPKINEQLLWKIEENNSHEIPSDATDKKESGSICQIQSQHHSEYKAKEAGMEIQPKVQLPQQLQQKENDRNSTIAVAKSERKEVVLEEKKNDAGAEDLSAEKETNSNIDVAESEGEDVMLEEEKNDVGAKDPSQVQVLDQQEQKVENDCLVGNTPSIRTDTQAQNFILIPTRNGEQKVRVLAYWEGGMFKEYECRMLVDDKSSEGWNMVSHMKGKAKKELMLDMFVLIPAGNGERKVRVLAYWEGDMFKEYERRMLVDDESSEGWNTMSYREGKAKKEPMLDTFVLIPAGNGEQKVRVLAYWEGDMFKDYECRMLADNESSEGWNTLSHSKGKAKKDLMLDTFVLIPAGNGERKVRVLAYWEGDMFKEYERRMRADDESSEGWNTLSHRKGKAKKQLMFC